MAKRKSEIAKQAEKGQVDAFLQKLASAPVIRPAGERGRLLFALDATMSRQPAWDRACHIQAEMFEETAAIGGLDIQLAWFRGHGEFSTTKWLSDSASLLDEMTGVTCRGGFTQIEAVLRHAIAETKNKRIQALVYVGDCLEEDIDRLCAMAGELGLLGVPAFMFHEGGDPTAAQGFREIARLTGGAYCPFDASSAKQLGELLRAVAVYAAGGRTALEDFSKRAGGEAVRLLGHLK